jgi:outer membrane protein assembly factor BamB
MYDMFAVIPSAIFLAPLAVLAALFPATFASFRGAFQHWRAFLIVLSVNGFLVTLDHFLRAGNWLPDSPFVSPLTVAAYQLLVVGVGLGWAGSRYRRAAAVDPDITAPARRKYIITLFGIAIVAGVGVVGAVVASYGYAAGSLFAVRRSEVVGTLFQLPVRDLSFAVLGLVFAGVYLAYRACFQRASVNRTVRLSLSGETVALGAMLVCGAVAIALLAPRTATTTTALESNSFASVASPIRLIDASIVYESSRMTDALSGVTISDGLVYFGGFRAANLGSNGAIECFDLKTGQLRWSFSEPGLRSVFCTPAVANGRLFCGEGLHTDRNCRLLCIDAASGQKIWEFRTTSHTEGTPSIDQNRVYFSAGDDGLFCTTTDGVEVWHDAGREKYRHIDSPLTLAHGRVYAGSGYQTFAAFALEAATGKEAWRKNLPGRSFGQPLRIDQSVYYGVGTGNLSFDLSVEPEPGVPSELRPAGAIVCLNASSGEEVWRRDFDRSMHTQLTADNRTVYAVCRDGWLYALERTTGAILWRFNYGLPMNTGTAVATYSKLGFCAAVYVATPTGGVYAHDPLTGKLFWSRELAQLTGRDVEIAAPPTVLNVDPAGSQRQIFLPVSLVNRNSGARTAAVVKLLDQVAE